ncbi:hypothetical protein [Alistipes sp. An116]|nr:hypothetical protein [Alistipes sp. An116]
MQLPEKNPLRPDDDELLADEERRQQLRTGGTRDTASTPASHTSRQRPFC